MTTIQTGYSVDATYSKGMKFVPTVTVMVTKPDGSVATEADISGNGPVDAAYKAIQRALDIEVKLTHFEVEALTSGSDAVGKTTVQIEYEGRVYTGIGEDTDIVEASIQAYVDALNRHVAFEACVEKHKP